MLEEGPAVENVMTDNTIKYLPIKCAEIILFIAVPNMHQIVLLARKTDQHFFFIILNQFHIPGYISS